MEHHYDRHYDDRNSFIIQATGYIVLGGMVVGEGQVNGPLNKVIRGKGLFEINLTGISSGIGCILYVGHLLWFWLQSENIGVLFGLVQVDFSGTFLGKERDRDLLPPSTIGF